MKTFKTFTALCLIALVIITGPGCAYRHMGCPSFGYEHRNSTTPRLPISTIGYRIDIEDKKKNH